MIRNTFRLAASAGAIIAASMASGALAQEAADGEDAPRVQRDTIVVTAQKREENLLDVPISISVVDGETLQAQGAASLADYAGTVPGLNVDSGGTPGLSTITLRGIAPTTSSAAVGVYLDEAPVGSSSLYARANELSLDLLPYDIERIEVLRGPQGTLYGASSIGGLLKYVTVEPDLNELGLRAGGDIFDIKGAGDIGWAARGMVNAPLVEGKAGLTGSVAWRSTPGYVDSVNAPGLTDQNEYEQFGGRVSFLARPTGALSIKLTAIHQMTDAESNGQYAADLAGNRLGNGTSYNNFIAEPFYSNFDFYSATIGYDLGGVELTSSTAYNERETEQVLDASLIFGTLYPLLTAGAIPAGLSSLTYNTSLEKFTQELRLASTGDGAFQWLVGGFYTHEDSLQTQLVRAFDMAGTPIVGLDPLATVELPATYKEYAVFANATISLTEAFEITGGLRYARNEQTFRQVSGGALVPAANDPGESDESIVTFSVSPQFRFGEDSMIYGRVATGYRPGGPNVIVPGVPPTVDSDRLTNYEIGYKGSLGAGLVTLELAAFYMDWTDIQVAQSFGGIGGLANGGKATSKGLEGAVVFNPLPGLSFSLNGAYTDATLSEDVPAISGLDGDRLPNVPEFSGSARVDYVAELANGNSVALGAGLRHTGSRLSLVESDPQAVRAKDYTSLDLNIGYTFNDRWTLRAYARNVFNDKGELSRSLTVDGLDQPVFLAITPLQPRTFGLAAELAF